LTAELFRMHALLARMVEADIRFVLVGGLAVGAWGYVRGTKDVDVVPDPAEENLERLAELLRELDGKVEVEDRLLTADAISIFLRTGDRTLVATELGPVDVLQGLPQVPSFAVLDAQATDVDIGGLRVRVCSLEHLLEMKRSSERPRDRDDLESLEAAQQSDSTED
jgi:predicted nucleotidyltransferase